MFWKVVENIDSRYLGTMRGYTCQQCFLNPRRLAARSLGCGGPTQTQSRQVIGQEVHFSNLSGVVSPEGLDWARRGGDNMRKGT